MKTMAIKETAKLPIFPKKIHPYCENISGSRRGSRFLSAILQFLYFRIHGYKQKSGRARASTP
jgi:hypothetical protein